MKDLSGTKLQDRYEVLELLGRGGMAVVYKVMDTVRAVPLAMKLLREDFAEDVVFLRRFQREAQNLARLQHPHIVRSYGLEREGDYSFMLMDYVDGTTLRKEIFRAKAPLDPHRTLEIMRPVCSALHYAHQMGIIHCDVKPANIMIDTGGRVLVTDFGIARMSDAATSTMVGAGTPAYMSPEQIMGADPTPETDIYALGAVMFEMMTGGERPFTGERSNQTGTTAEQVRWEKMNLDAPSPKKWNPALTDDLEAIILRCLHKEPAERYSSTMELLAALEAAIVPGNDVDRLPSVMGEDDQETVIEPPPDAFQPEEMHAAPSVSDGAGVPPIAASPSSGKRRSKLPKWSWALVAGVVVLGGFFLLRTLIPERLGGNFLQSSSVSPSGALIIGSSLEDEVTGSGGDEWLVELTEEDVVDISMRAVDGMDTVLELFNAQGVRLAIDDDGGEGHNSRLIAFIPETGTYTLVARGYDGAQGRYVLDIGELQYEYMGELEPGDQVNATLTAGMPLHIWAYQGSEGEFIRISMVGYDDFDSTLELIDPDGSRLAYDDDSGGGVDSLLEVELDHSGWYYILAAGYEYRVGSYSLHLE